MKKYLQALCLSIYNFLVKMEEIVFLFFVIDFLTHWPGQILLWLQNYVGFHLSVGQQETLTWIYKLVKFTLFALLYAPSMLLRAKRSYKCILQEIKDLMSRF